MCSYKTLHHSEHGYIVKCGQCQVFQLGFGTVAISFTSEQLRDFQRTVRNCYEMHKGCACPGQKSIRIPTAMRSLSLALSIHDLDMLLDMMEEAHISLEIENMLA